MAVDVSYHARNPVALRRQEILLSTLTRMRPFFDGQDVLDFGAADGLSMCAVRQLGARSVVGVEPDNERVVRGQANMGDWGRLWHLADTSRLPFADNQFGAVLCNAVLEHIPQPRDAHIREMWRVLKPGGHLLVNETPNKYLPFDVHTTNLPLVNWLPSGLAKWISVKLGRFNPQNDWDHSGWRGLGHFELVSNLDGYVDVSPKTRPRHYVIGQLLDPYPEFVLRKSR